MRTSTILAALFVALGFLCHFTYRLIGSEVDGSGLLREPFALVPLGWLFLVLGTGLFLTVGLRAMLAFLRRNNSR